MPAIYLCDVIGSGTSTRDPFRPSLVTSNSVCLMIDDGPRKKAIVWALDTTLTGTGITKLIEAASKDALITKLQTSNPTAGARNQVNTWLTASGYSTLPGSAVSWEDVVLFACRQVNPAVDLSVIVA